MPYNDQIIAIDADKEIHTGTPEEMLRKGIPKKVFHVDVHRSNYLFEVKTPLRSAARPLS